MTYIASALKGKEKDPEDQADTSAATLPAASGSSADQALVLRAQSGDRGAFDALVRKYRHRVMQVCRRYMQNSEDAEDAVQITLMKAYRGLKRFRGDAAFYSWLHRIAITSAMTLASLEMRRERFFVLDHAELSEALMPQAMDTPEGLALADETLRVVWEAIASLCEEQRATLMLHELHGKSYSEVAQAMSCPVGTVRSRVFRAREAIDAKVKRIYVGGLGRARIKYHLTASRWPKAMNDSGETR
jgi:RNA polymerase sigma-70 factor, ECF subfamily